MQANEKLYLNGIDAETGQYLIPPIAIEDAGAMLKGTDASHERRASADRTRGTSSGSGRSQLAASDLAGVEPAASRPAARTSIPRNRGRRPAGRSSSTTDESDDVKQALEPLIAHRRTRVGADRCQGAHVREGEANARSVARAAWRRAPEA